jgi:hypothetical protein
MLELAVVSAAALALHEGEAHVLGGRLVGRLLHESRPVTRAVKAGNGHSLWEYHADEAAVVDLC